MQTHYRQIIDLSQDSIEEIGLDGRILFANIHARQRAGCKEGESLLGVRWADLWSKNHHAKLEQAIEAAVRGADFSFEADGPGRSGQSEHWVVLTKPLVDADGRIVGLVAVNHDVTAKHLAEAALHTLNTRLSRQLAGVTESLRMAAAREGQRNRPLLARTSAAGNADEDTALHRKPERDLAAAAQLAAESMYEQAQKDEAIGQLLAGAVHDLNGMLHTAMGAVEMVSMSGATDERQRKLLEMAESSLQRGSKMVARLLGFARKHTVTPVDTDIGALVEELLPLLRQAVGPRVELSVEAAEQACRAFVDAHSIERAILNLVINARDACEDAGREQGNIAIRIFKINAQDIAPGGERLDAMGRWIAISVTDNGIGMTSDVQARLFEAYFTTKPEGRGTGLGLAQVYGAVRVANGYVDVYSAPGAGTRITIALPAC